MATTVLNDLEDDLPIALGDYGEGVEREEQVGDDRITNPFDPKLIRVQSQLLTLDLLVGRIRDGAINLTPDFQRKGGLWSNGAKSRLIESLLIRIPLPAFYMDASDEDKWLVVDGLQRLTTLQEFILEKNPKKQLKLTELEFLTEELEGSNWDSLSPLYKRRINETQVTVYKIEPGTPDQVKFNIFKRINTGGLPLSAQEIRHALNQGPATKFLHTLAENSAFLGAIDDGVSDDRMARRELVLRFLAFYLTPYTDYGRKDLDSFLNETMSVLNKAPAGDLAASEKVFLLAMERAQALFGKLAFRKVYRRNARKTPINKALFETWSVNLARLTALEAKSLIARKERLMSEFIKLMNDPAFEKSVTQGTGDRRQVEKRFSEVEALIRRTLND